MSDDDFDDDGYDLPEDTDATIRRLENEIARLTAELDQLSAWLAEQKADMAELRAKGDELDRAIARLMARRKRDRWVIPVWMLFWAAFWTVLFNWLF